MTGISSDFRDIEDAAAAGEEKAQVALDAYAQRVKKYIGSYAAEMNGVDAVVFTAGVGENQWGTRQDACEGLEFLGVKIDKEVNKGLRGVEKIISTADSKVTVCVIPTDEELMIATDTMELL